MDTGTTEAGTITLSAALDVARGNVIGSMQARHRPSSSRSSLVELDKEVPADLEVHLILDNHATDKTEATKH
jgi:hypothetical protein